MLHAALGFRGCRWDGSIALFGRRRVSSWVLTAWHGSVGGYGPCRCYYKGPAPHVGSLVCRGACKKDSGLFRGLSLSLLLSCVTLTS